MAHTYTNILVHALFSTKHRQPWLKADIREEIFCYLGGAVNALGGKGSSTTPDMSLRNQAPDAAPTGLTHPLCSSSSHGWRRGLSRPAGSPAPRA